MKGSAPLGSGPAVVKLGGSLLEIATLRAAALKSVAARWREGDRFIVVHGGGKQVDASLAARGIPRKVHQGLRITDLETLYVVVSVLSGLVNKSLVGELRALGVTAAGFCGADGGTWRAERHPRAGGIDYGHVGKVVRSDERLIEAVLNAGMLPVLASVAADARGRLLNVNADAAAAALAEAVRARRLIFLTDVEGLMDSEGRVIDRIDASGARKLIESGAVEGGMRPKLAACLQAVAAGVPEVLIAGPSRHGGVLKDGLGGTCLVAA